MGISTGFCTVGNFGSDQRMDYTIMGTAVNLAARLEGVNHVNDVAAPVPLIEPVVVENRHGEELSQLEDVERIYFAGRPHALGILEAIDHYDFFGSCMLPTTHA